MNLTIVEFDSKILKRTETGLMSWLRENVGHGAAGRTSTTWTSDKYNWWYYWHDYTGTIMYVIEFRNPNDATLFKLTWF